MDLAKLNGGSGIIRYRGLEIESKEGIFVAIEHETSDLPIDGISAKADQRVDATKITITVTPSGKWINPQRLLPYLDMPAGRFVLPVLPVTINETTDVLTAGKHLFYDGDRVMCGIRAGGTLPAAVDEATFYYVRVLDADTFTLHTSRAGALGNTGKVNFATTGTSVVVIGQFDLEIIGEDGERVTFHAAAITSQPTLNLTRRETPFGEVEWTAFLRNRKRTSDADAFYSIDTPGFPGWTAAAADIRTQSPWLAWANQLKVSNVDTTDNELDFAAEHGLTTEQAVYLGTTGTLPSATPALDPERKYYVRAVDTNSVSLHLTAAAATAGTGAIDLGDVGTGTLFITVDNPPFTLMDTEAGVEIESEVELEERDLDRDGVVNARLVSCDLQAKFVALSLGTPNVFSMLRVQGAGATMGRSLNAGSKPLNIFSEGIFVRLNGAVPLAGQAGWSMTEDRARELTVVSTRVVSGGTLQPVGHVGTEIP